ncbi:replication initiation protein [uncultured Clostridium sp.]|uniref:replication initiation protein n=1 Tax=uncultured Clostridium sp. TaxID=59620 RepID=UPI00272B9FBB|nr:replication initiation protein [uncultured Clostridium sp.]
MPRGHKQVNGQISFDFCIDARNYVVQANNLIGGKQALKLNSAKLIRSAIMQVVREDEELKPYIITIKDLSELLGVPASNIYRDVDEITDDIIKNPVYIREEKNGKTIDFIKIPWVTRCEYKSDVGIALKLNEELKPFLINLKEHYTQYTLQEVLAMKSVYGIRIFEMLQSKIMSRVLPKNGIVVLMSVQEIRECCDCEDKYPAFGNFRDKVIDKAVKEINRVTMFKVVYSYIKKARSVVEIKFDINMRYH